MRQRLHWLWVLVCFIFPGFLGLLLVRPVSNDSLAVSGPTNTASGSWHLKTMIRKKLDSRCFSVVALPVSLRGRRFSHST